jgi:hypothetical protein
MMTRLPVGLAAFALVLALLASGFFLFGPSVNEVNCRGSITPNGPRSEECTSSSSSLLEDGDTGLVLVITIVPVGIAAAVLVLAWRGGARVERWLLGAGFAVLCLITGFTVGMFYLPAALVSLLSVGLDRRTLPVAQD